MHMVDLSGVVRWWEERQLRILVLASLAVHWLLLFSAPLRKLRIRPYFRFFIWLAYLGNDSLAIYALATLFNRHKQQGQDGSSSVLEVLWAPILLVHVGGNGVVISHNIEDNELWRRHMVTAWSQIAVAIYVFCKTWPAGGDHLLLGAAILLFYQGVAACINKPFLLQLGTVNGLVVLTASTTRGKTHGIPLEKFVQKARDFVRDDRAPRPPPPDNDVSVLIRGQPSRQILDLLSSYSDRLDILRYFWFLDDNKVYDTLREGLSNSFDAVYTMRKSPGIGGAKLSDLKMKTSLSKLRGNPTISQLMGLSLGTLLPLIAIVLFHKSHKQDYGDADIMITYILFCCTVVSQFFTCVFYWLLSYSPIWPQEVAQHSILVFFKKRSAKPMLLTLAYSLALIARLVYLSQLVDESVQSLLQLFYSVDPCGPSSSRCIIIDLVLVHLRSGWKEHIHDAATYRMFNDQRGQLTLRHNGCYQQLGWSITLPFDESVLLWHIATDLCFYHHTAPPIHGQGNQETVRCRQISNYMVHLLYEKSEMLMVGARPHLFTAAYKELDKVFKGEKPPKEERGIAWRIIAKVREQHYEGSPRGASIIHEAWALAEALLGLGDKKKMWEVIQGVWVEMLCFSAGRCRGYLHAKSLGAGGEFLNYVWLLMSYMGMETLAERMQRAELQSGDGGNNGGAARQTSDEVRAGDAAPTTEIIIQGME